MHDLHAIKQAQAAWTAAGHDARRVEVNFMESCISRLQAGRILSSGQDRWLSSILASSPPLRADELALADRLKVVVDRFSLSLPREVMGTRQAAESFAEQLRRGERGLSEAQQRLAEKIATMGDADAWSPSETELQDIDRAIDLGMGRSPMWWGHRGGTWQALKRVQSARASSYPFIKADVDKLLEVFSACLEELRNPKFEAGALVFDKSAHAVSVVAGPPEAMSGGVGYPLIQGDRGAVRVVRSDFLRKRLK